MDLNFVDRTKTIVKLKEFDVRMSQMQKKVIIIVNLWKDFLLRKYFVHVQFKQFLFYFDSDKFYVS